MTRLHNLPTALKESLFERKLFKVIAGLSNFNKESVQQVSWAAGQGGADLVDIACDAQLVHLAKKASQLPICVSSIIPEQFPEAVAAGASLVEIGNYDSFYPTGRLFSAEEVLILGKTTRNLLPETVISVTVPHLLPLDEQARLAIDLVECDIDIIQTEGSCSAKAISPGSLGLIEKAAPTLAATHTIANALTKENCPRPILSASGLSEVTVGMAISAGASGVGIGSAVNKLNDQLAMIATVKNIKNALLTSTRYINNSQAQNN